ncbi:DUF4956 domain-containing protein [Mariniluteicoccus flavus]
MNLLPYVADLVAISVLTLGVYYPRHRRRDLVVAYFGVNVGVMGVTAALANATVAAGLGLGLFGVLSIIRLRSDELSQREVAYYFAALAIGLLSGLGTNPAWLGLALMGLLVLVMFAVDHPSVLGTTRRTIMVLDRAWDDEAALSAHLAQRLGARIDGVTVQRIDHVNDTTTIEVRHTPTPPRGAGSTRTELVEAA